ncbi:hypothetical protein BKA62DRAFT_765909 [Auriculariales sp. MPI-PUGE-AT-0066]|nr:hypothetical protein BKA62DRAFT_765909 [Auriculariales sp. MPI-PUGE-AT-0066]
MSLVATTFKEAPRLARRQTSHTATIERPLSPSRHMRLLPAFPALQHSNSDFASSEQQQLSTRERGTSWNPLTLPGLRRTSQSPHRSLSPSPTTSSPVLSIPPASAIARTPLYSPRSPLSQRTSPTGSYFPYVPSRPSSPNPPRALTNNFATATALAATRPVAPSGVPGAFSSNIGAVAPPQPHVSTPPHMGPSLDSTRKHMRGQSLEAHTIVPVSPPKPTVIDLTRPTITIPSPLSKATAARMPELSSRPQVDIQSTRFSHALSIYLPGYAADEVTLTVARNEAIKIVADKWSAAADDKCHLEWLVTFAPRDANMYGIHASFAKETLCVTVPRSRQDNRDSWSF